MLLVMQAGSIGNGIVCMLIFNRSFFMLWGLSESDIDFGRNHNCSKIRTKGKEEKLWQRIMQVLPKRY